MLFATKITSGFGNRLKCAVSLIRALQMVESEPVIDDMRIIWYSGLDQKQVNYDFAELGSFYDLFDSPLKTIDPGEARAMADKGQLAYWECWRWDKLNHIDLMFSETPEVDKVDIANILKLYFKPSEKVWRIVEQRWPAVEGHDVGLFLRTGTNQRLDYNENYNRIEDIKFDPEKKYFIISDTPRVWRYCRAYSNLTCFLDEDYMYGAWHTHYANAILLSEMPELILPNFSTFSEVIHALTGFNKPVNFLPKRETRAHGTVDHRAALNDYLDECEKMI